MQIHGGAQCYSYIELRGFRKPRIFQRLWMTDAKTGAPGISHQGFRDDGMASSLMLPLRLSSRPALSVMS